MMNEKINWMLGMSENMKNITMNYQDRPEMNEVMGMVNEMKANLHVMQHVNVDSMFIDIAEPMMRSMEQIMMYMNYDDKNQVVMMRYMMHYMIMMQRTKIR
jgi:DNA-binding LytR/AlgR family response regulator